MGGKILLVEDDNNLRETLGEVLRAEGWEVVPVPNGQAAMDALDKPNAAQVVILDALLPKVSGFDVAKFVRARGIDVPIVFISGVYKSADQQKDAKEKYGCRAYLTKPFDGKRLVDVIKPLMAAAQVPVLASSAAPVIASAVSAPLSAAAATNPSSPPRVAPLPADGSLLESPVLYLLWRAALENHTGILELFAERERARVFVFKGRAMFAQHSDAQLNVGVELVREGILNAETYVQACELAMQRGSGLFDVLKAESWCTEQQARAGYKMLIPRILERVVALSGRFRWVQTDQFATLVPTSSVSIIEPLLAGLRKATERDLDPHVGPRRPLRLAPGDTWSELIGKLQDACGSESLIKSINGRATIAQMLEAAPNPVEKTARYRQVYLLMSTMAVRASLESVSVGGGAEVAQPRPSPAMPEERATSGFSMGGASQPQSGQGQARGMAHAGASKGGAQRPFIDDNADSGVTFTSQEQAVRTRIAEKLEEIIGKDYFAILGVKRGVDAASVKRAYFALAKEFHTDAFAGLNLGTAQKKLDHVFQTIQTAHATLTDATKRGEYEARLSFEETGSSTDVAAIMQAETDLHKAKLLVDRGELGSASKVLEKVVAVMPTNAEALGYQRYCAWYQTKNPLTAQETVKALEQHWKAAPGSLALKEFQGWIWMEVGELRAARIAFKKVLELDPKHGGATRGSRQLQRKVEEEEKKGSSGLSKFLKR